MVDLPIPDCPISTLCCCSIHGRKGEASCVAASGTTMDAVVAAGAAADPRAFAQNVMEIAVPPG